MKMPADVLVIFALASDHPDLIEGFLHLETCHVNRVTFIRVSAESRRAGQMKGSLTIGLICIAATDDNVVDTPAA